MNRAEQGSTVTDSYIRTLDNADIPWHRRIGANQLGALKAALRNAMILFLWIEHGCAGVIKSARQ